MSEDIWTRHVCEKCMCGLSWDNHITVTRKYRNSADEIICKVEDYLCTNCGQSEVAFIEYVMGK